MQDDVISPELQRAKINLETASAPWTALERFFAQGRLVWVAPTLNLLDVALAASQDEAAKIAAWQQAGELRQPEMAQARIWQADNQQLWTVVVKPWVFIQETDAADS